LNDILVSWLPHLTAGHALLARRDIPLVIARFNILSNIRTSRRLFRAAWVLTSDRPVGELFAVVYRLNPSGVRLVHLVRVTPLPSLQRRRSPSVRPSARPSVLRTARVCQRYPAASRGPRRPQERARCDVRWLARRTTYA
jgi:hypothetical protein